MDDRGLYPLPVIIRRCMMTVLKAFVFIASLLAIPVSGFLTVLYIIIDMVRYRQIQEENGDG